MCTLHARRLGPMLTDFEPKLGCTNPAAGPSMALPASRLSPLLAPRSVAIVGASPRENTLGNNVVVNLRSFGYAGRIMPVHPSAPEVAGLPAYRAFGEPPGPAGCALPARPADK